MAIDINEAVSVYEEREAQKRAATRKRTIRLIVICVVIGIVRLVVKDPPPPKRAEHARVPGVARPGMLDRIPLAEQAKMDPKILAQLREADTKARTPGLKSAEEIVRGPYVPTEAPPEDVREKQLDQEYAYQYVRRQKIVEEKKQVESVDVTKPTLVRFKHGRFVKARRARDVSPYMAIELDRTIVASLPKKIILSVTDDALTWKEPVEKGKVRLKPAKGITITVNKNIAQRITVLKSYRNES